MKATIVIEDKPTEEDQDFVHVSVEFSEPVTSETPLTAGAELAMEFLSFVENMNKTPRAPQRGRPAGGGA